MTRRAALRHAVSMDAWRDAIHIDLGRATVAAPVRVGVAVGVVLVIGGILGRRDLAGLAALGALVSAFCRPDPYPIRAPRLVTLAVAITGAVASGAAIGAASAPLIVEILVISVLAGAAGYLMSALHIVGPGAIIVVFAASGAAVSAHDIADIGRAVAATAIGAMIGLVAALAPWPWQWLREHRSVSESPTPRVAREPLWRALAGGQSGPARCRLITAAVRMAAASALAAAAATAVGLAHPMWAAMGAVAAMQGVSYHHIVSRGLARLLGNIGGAVLAAILLALPLGYWGAVAVIIVCQIAAEILSTVNYAMCSLAVTPMALALTGLGAGLSPGAALDRVADTAIGIVIGIAVTAIVVIPGDDPPTRR